MNLPKPMASIGDRPRVRGMECRSPSGLAEAFYARALVL